jgi:DNA-binding transcriptional LysR family regulator
MLNDVTELRTFVRVVATGSLSAAAREMGLALSVVSKRLATLERRTAARLVARNTRRLSLTEEGQGLYEHAQRILAEVDEAEAALTRGRANPSGVLRVSAPFSLGRAHVSPVCRDLVRAYPKLSIELNLTDKLVDMIEHGIDVAVRIGEPKDSGLVMRKLLDNYRIIVAAPDYLDRHGTPRSPAELQHYECLSYRGVGARWRLVGPAGQTADVRATSRLRCDNGEVAYDWALAGCGLVMKSWVDVASDLSTGRVIRVLPEWRSEPTPICALFSSSRQLPTRVHIFLESISKRLHRLPVA